MYVNVVQVQVACWSIWENVFCENDLDGFMIAKGHMNSYINIDMFILLLYEYIKCSYFLLSIRVYFIVPLNIIV